MKQWEAARNNHGTGAGKIGENKISITAQLRLTIIFMDFQIPR
jgi:hypothetical protein